MHLKFETKSNRVKGLAFHPTRPWILASLHNGLIQLWDYRIRTLVDKFDEHVGPVRSVCFHPVQPLFVSGGDDYKIKVWNFKKRRCLFTLLGHLDYVRTVQFHPGECPWILSASDDQTIRIWNWQSRTCLSVLTGHNHYVMCAQFHPRDDLIVSASLDQTVRVWDVAGLRKKSFNPKAGPPPIPGSDSDAARLQSDLFGSSDALVKYVLEAHERGVNWAAFHPTQPLIISGADDRLLKLWRVNESKAWEVDTFRGHFHNVSCVIFHPRYEIVISNSEDKTIRAWDLNKRTSLQTFRRENDRFWILAAHPTQNVVAAGHDSGLVLFKLVSERIPIAVAGSQFLYVSNNFARAFDTATSRDIPICSLRAKSLLSPLAPNASHISFSAADRCLVLCFKSEGGQYELYQLPPDSSRGGEALDCRKGAGQGAAFVGRKRFAVLEKKQLVVRDLSNAEVKRVPVPANADWLFPGPAPGTVLLRMEDRVGVFDIQQRRVVAEVAAPGVRHVVWSTGSSTAATPQRVALLSKDTVTIATAKLEILGSAHELIRIKSAAWDESGVLIYSTLSHLKYMLPQNGDHGTIRAIDAPMYVACVKGTKVFCVDREGVPRVIAVNPTEYVFKLALAQRRFADVLRMVREANLVGAALVAYLQQRGFPEIALHFVRDERLRFDLALECGNIDAALEAARAVNDTKCWRRLAHAALAQGNHQVVEMAYQRVRDFARLSFLYAATGNTEKLRKMLKIAEMRADVESVFHNALYLGDVEERAKALAGAGLPQLAYLVAASHGLNEAADLYAKQTLESTPGGELPAVSPSSVLLAPPVPIVRAGDGNWPLLNVSKGWADTLLAATAAPAPEEKVAAAAVAAAAATTPEAEAEGEAAWGGDDVLGTDRTPSATAAVAKSLTPTPSTDGWDTGEQLDALKELEATAPAASAGAGAGSGGARAGGKDAYYVVPVHGTDAAITWCKNSALAIDHAAAGNVESASRLLSQQVGLASIAPLRPHFTNAFAGAHALTPGLPCAPPLRVPLQRNEAALPPTTAGRLGGLPAIAGASNVAALAERLRDAYSMFTRGQFPEALAALRDLMHAALCAVAASRQEADELRELRGICREYALALLIELRRRELVSAKAEPAKQIELAAYLTHINLQLPHLVLVLRAAMNSAFSNKNFATAAAFARRLLELNPKQDIAQTAQKVCQYADSNSTEAHKLQYDERNPFVVCSFTFTPIYRGSPQINCPYCAAAALPEYAGKLCPVCVIGSMGRTDVTGFTCYKQSVSK